MLKQILFSIFFALTLFSADVNAKTYQLPDDDLPNCEKNGNNYTCSGNFKADESVTFSGIIDSDGHITFEESSEITGNLTAGGKVTIDEDSQLTGNIVAGKKVSIDENVTIDGNINADAKVELDEDSVVTGYVNAPDVSGEGNVQGDTCDINDNIGPCSGSPGTPTIEPIGYWYFDELNWTGSTGEVIDQSGNNYNGQALRNASTSGFASAIDADLGTCRYGKFSGDNVVQVPNATDISQADSISIAFWFKGDANLQNQNESYQTLLMVGDGPTESSTGRFEVYRQDSSDGGGIYFEIRLGNNTIVNVEAGNQLEGGMQLLDDTWHHLAATYSRDDRRLQIFIDGNLIEQRSFNGNRNLNSVSSNLFIGGQSTASNSFYGELDEVFISDEVMSTDDVLTLMLTTRPCANTRPQCSAVWPQGFSPANNVPLPFDLLDRALNSQLPGTLQPIDYLRVGDFSDVGANYSTNGQTSRVYIDGDLTIQSGRRINTGGSANELILVVTGDLYLEKDVEINGYIYVQGNLYFEQSIFPWNRSEVSGALSLAGQASSFGFPGFLAPTIAYGAPNEPLDGGNFCEAGGTEPPVVVPDHYRLSYTSPALTCEATEVTIEACADASCSSYSPVSSTVYLSEGAGQWSQNPAVVAPAASVGLSQLEAGDYTLAVDYIQTTPGALNPTQCYVNGSLASDCEITFNDTGLKFGAIPNQVSGVSFSSTLSVVRLNDETKACEVVAEQVNEVDMGMYCVNPGSCSDFTQFPYAQMTADNTQIDELEESGSGVVEGWTAVVTDFVDGEDLFTVQYGDAGQVKLHAKAQLPNGKVIEGVSNDFVYKPAEISLQTVSNYSGDILAKAGEAFSMTLQAVNADGQVTPNFGRETPQETLNIASVADAVLPSENDGNIENAGNFIAQDIGSIRFDNTTVAYTEVGNARVTAQIADQDYLGTGTAATDHNIGRFIPFAFEPLTAEFTGTCTDFYYMGQPQLIELSARAVNAGGAVTANYDGSLAKAIPLFYAYDGQSGLAEPLSGHSVSENPANDWQWNNGVGQFIGSASVTVSRSLSQQPSGPYESYTLGWQLDDQENGNFYSILENSELPAVNGAARLDSSSLYYGRVNLQDTYAAMGDVMPVAGAVEYWEGESFVTNEKDACSTFSRADIQLRDDLTAGPYPELETTPAELSVRDGLLNPSDVDINELFRWVSEQESEPYSFLLEAQVPAYLQYDWSGDGNFDENPQAEGTFGIYRGRDRQIYWREVGW
jgi:MSHA biogenesis protein MshQ